MIRAIKVSFIAFVVLAVSAISILFVFRMVAVSFLNNTVIKQAALAINKDIVVGNISIFPVKGIILQDIVVSEKGSGNAPMIKISSIRASLNIPHFIQSGQMVVTMRLDGARSDNIGADGTFILEVTPQKKSGSFFSGFSLYSLTLSGVDMFFDGFKISALNGGILYSGDNTASLDLSFSLNDHPHTLKASISGLGTAPEFSAVLKDKIYQAKIEAGIKDSVYTIKNLTANLNGSVLQCSGTFSAKEDRAIDITGKLKLNPHDLCNINEGLKNTCDYLRTEGLFESSFSLTGSLRDIRDVVFSGKFDSKWLKLWDYNFYDSTFTVSLKDGILAIPDLKADAYKGVLSSTFKMDMTALSRPYALAISIDRFNVHDLAQDSDMKNKNIYGVLSSSFSLTGNGPDQESITGSGKIEISEANLGPMPVLAPLLGNVYGFLRNAMPQIKTVEISGGRCDFMIKNRKVATENLVLTGDILNIYAKGYIDFDKALNFVVENEVKQSQDQPDSLQNSIIQVMASFGKMIGKAYLTGTLSKPSWKFEYFSQLQNSLGGQISNALKDIFE